MPTWTHIIFQAKESWNMKMNIFFHYYLIEKNIQSFVCVCVCLYLCERIKLRSTNTHTKPSQAKPSQELDENWTSKFIIIFIHCVCVFVFIINFFFHLIDDYKFLSMIFFFDSIPMRRRKKITWKHGQKKPVLKLLMNFILMERWLFCFSLVSFCNAWMNFPMHNSRTTTKIRKKNPLIDDNNDDDGVGYFCLFHFCHCYSQYIYIFFLFVSHELIHLDFFFFAKLLIN